MIQQAIIASGRLLEDSAGPLRRGRDVYIFRVPDIVALPFITQQIEELVLLYRSPEGSAEVLEGHRRLGGKKRRSWPLMLYPAPKRRPSHESSWCRI